MKSELVYFNGANTNQLLFKKFLADGTSNSGERNHMKQILIKAISKELTDKQRICIIEHYFNQKKQKDIAFELGLNTSTVSRHINAGKRKLQNIASYYF